MTLLADLLTSPTMRSAPATLSTQKPDGVAASKPYLPRNLLDPDDSTSDDDSSEESEEADTSDDDSSKDSDEDDSQDEDSQGDESSYWSATSTLTSMPSLAVIPKGRLARYAPTQFHTLYRAPSTSSNSSNESSRKKQQQTKDEASVTRSKSGKSSRVKQEQAQNEALATPVIPPRARLSPIIRPAVAIRRQLERPTVGGPVKSRNNVTNSAWWEMPLDAILGYPTLPTTKRAWDPHYEYDGDEDTTTTCRTKEEGSI